VSRSVNSNHKTEAGIMQQWEYWSEAVSPERGAPER
jgi:hypothetical protein